MYERTDNEKRGNLKGTDVRSCDEKTFENGKEECVMNERRQEKKTSVEKDVDKPVRKSGRVVKKSRRLSEED